MDAKELVDLQEFCFELQVKIVDLQDRIKFLENENNVLARELKMSYE